MHCWVEKKLNGETVCGIEIPVEERTPLVESMLRVIEQLWEENQELRCEDQRLRLGNQQLQQRVEQLEEEILRLKGFPEKPNRPLRPRAVQQLRVEPYNIKHHRKPERSPNGRFLTASLAEGVTSHFGPTLQQCVLYRHLHNHSHFAL